MFTLAFALLGGCSSWIDQEADCEYLVYDWSDDLLGYILTGDGSGSFDLDPVDAPRATVSGEYDPSDGEYDYEVEYDDDYWLEEAQAEGFGTVFHNGNLDLKHTLSFRDKLGQTWATYYRIQRNECELRVATWSEGEEDAAWTLEGEYEDDTTFEWEIAMSEGTYTGGWSDDLSEWADYDDGSYSTSSTTDAEEGETAYTFAYQGGDDSYAGTSVFKWDGDMVGQLEFVNAGTSCTFRSTYGDVCNVECDDGSEGSWDYCPT